MTYDFSNDNGTEYDDNEIEGDDEILDADDPFQEVRDRDVQIGKRIAREKKYHAALVRTVSATPLDADLLPVPEKDVADDDEEREPKLAVDPAIRTRRSTQ
jgi:hypothetical protein